MNRLLHAPISRMVFRESYNYEASKSPFDCSGDFSDFS